MNSFNLYDEVVELRKVLYEYWEDNYNYSIDIAFPTYTPKKLRFLTSSVKQCMTEEITAGFLEVFENSVSLSDVWHELSCDYNKFNTKMKDIFNPIIIHLCETSYVVEIKKIHPVDSSLNIFHISEISNTIEIAFSNNDFGTVTANCSNLIQSLFKDILSSNSIQLSDKANFPEIQKQTMKLLKIEKTEHTELNKFIGSFNNALASINTIRNCYSCAHGSDAEKHSIFKDVPKHHYKFLIDTTFALVNFIIGSYEEKFNKRVLM